MYALLHNHVTRANRIKTTLEVSRPGRESGWPALPNRFVPTIHPMFMVEAQVREACARSVCDWGS